MSAATARRAPATTTPAPKKVEQQRPELRAVPPQPFPAPKGPFVLAIGAVLTLGLLGVLLLNTVVAQDAFQLSALQAKSAALADQQQALTQEVAAVESPERLDARARALGMVPSVNPIFIRLADGKVLGDPVAGKAPVRRVAAPTNAVSSTVPAAGSSPSATTAPTAGKPGTQETPNALRTKAATALRTKAATTTTQTNKTQSNKNQTNPNKKKAGQ